MKKLLIGAAVTSLIALSACGGKGDDSLGDNAAAAAENQADSLEAAADNATGAQEDALEAQAEATREAGEEKEEAIDDADVNAQGLSNGQAGALVNAQ